MCKVPLLIPNADAEPELSHLGKSVSSVKLMALNCKPCTEMHVVSFRRQVFMFLNEPNLDVSSECGTEGSPTCFMRIQEAWSVLNVGVLGIKAHIIRLRFRRMQVHHTVDTSDPRHNDQETADRG